MDIFTHSISGYLLKRWFYDIDSKKVLLLFILGALFPDIDIIWSHNNYNLHRVITHSLILIPFISIIPTTIFYYIFKKKIKFSIIYIIFIAGILMHVFLDTLLIWGTPLFWPISDIYYSLNLYTYVIEPLFIPIYLLFLLYYFRAIDKISLRMIKIMSLFVLFVFGLKFSIHLYINTISNIESIKTVGIVSQTSDLIIQRYYKTVLIEDNKIKGEIIDLYSGTIIEKYKKNIFYDENYLCANLHKGFLYLENGMVGDIRYSLNTFDSDNCFNGKKIN